MVSQHGERGGAADRVAAEGGAVRARAEQVGRVAERDAGADRQAAAEALGQGDDVGLDAVGLVGEPVPGAADAGLHLVEDEQRAVPGGDLPGRGEVARPAGRPRRSRPGSAPGSPSRSSPVDRGGQRRRRRRTARGSRRPAAAGTGRPWPAGRSAPARPSCGRGSRRRRRPRGCGRCSRDSLNAASLASAPELPKNTRPGRPASASSSSASATGGSATYRLETWPSVATCSADRLDHGRVGVAERVDRDAAEQVHVGLAGLVDRRTAPAPRTSAERRRAVVVHHGLLPAVDEQLMTASPSFRTPPR